ncbi:hypothetical protein SLE2022_392700 [Rubroshorea leprosula]
MYTPPERTSPVQSTWEHKPPKRHHSASHYAHRVRESLTTRVSKIICGIFLSFLLIFAIIAFILWLSLSPHRPRFFVQEFSIPGLAQPNGFENAEITFNVTVRNSNQHIGIYYMDSMVGTVYYRDQSIGSTTLSGPFYQSPKTTKVVDGVLGGATLNVNNARWTEFLNDRQQGTIVFRLGITSAIKFRVSTWDSKKHKIHVDCEVSVGPDGLLLASSINKRCGLYFT